MTPDLNSLISPELDAIVRLTWELVEIESPTTDPAAVNRVGTRIAAEMEALGADVTMHLRKNVGNIVEGVWHKDAPGKPLLFVAHMDTVHPVSAVNDNPVRIEEGRLFGPGVYDMKSSIAVVLTAIRVLRENDLFPVRPVIVLVTSDEETGSEYSRDLIRELAVDAALALIVEPAMPDGSVKTWRKSVAHFNVRTYGIAAHAGGAHETGLNAIEEMAHQVLKLQRMTNYKLGTTVSVGIISGGTRSNVIPDVCELHVDARAMTYDEMERLTREVHALKPVMPGSRVEAEGGFDRPPMERNDLMVSTFEQAKVIAAQYGIMLREGGTGGASDGNHTADVGTPTLDGLGPLGDGAHSEREHILINSLTERTVLAAALIRDWPGE